MAHFARLAPNNTVLQICVVNNEDILDENGLESEELGIQICRNTVDENSIWKQTSYNGSIRVRYAQVGGTYDPIRDAFIPERVFPSWTLNTETLDWDPPTPYPDDGKDYHWDESVLAWVEDGSGDT